MKQVITKKINYFNLKQSVVNFSKKVIPFSIRFFLRKANWKRMYYQDILFRKLDGDVYCPIANKTFKTFPRDITPSNGARSRHRLFWIFIEKETDILVKENSLLHFAPEYGIRQKFKKFINLTYVPADKMVNGYDYHKGIQNVDLLNINFKDNFFDYIICNRVLEHIVDDKKAMSEMYRVLKIGGTALITVPLDYNLEKTHESYVSRKDRIKYYGQWDHVRMYCADIKNRLKDVGFSVVLNKYSNNFSKEEMKKFGLCVDTIIIAKK